MELFSISIVQIPDTFVYVRGSWLAAWIGPVPNIHMLYINSVRYPWNYRPGYVAKIPVKAELLDTYTDAASGKVLVPSSNAC